MNMSKHSMMARMGQTIPNDDTDRIIRSLPSRAQHACYMNLIVTDEQLKSQLANPAGLRGIKRVRNCGEKTMAALFAAVGMEPPTKGGPVKQEQRRCPCCNQTIKQTKTTPTI